MECMYLHYKMPNMYDAFCIFEVSLSFIEHKLQELKLPRNAASEIVCDILESPTRLQHGLVDAKSVKEMYDMLKRFKTTVDLL